MRKKRKGKLDLDALLTEVVRLLIQHPPKSLTFSKVARLTGVPRSTLYYYFGKDRMTMIEEAVRFGVKSFGQIGSLSREKKFSSWEKYQQARFRVSTRLVRQYPWAPALYIRFRNDSGRVGEIVREVEAQFIGGTIQQWKRFHGRSPDPKWVEFASALKLGYLWGIAYRGDAWVGKSDAKAQEKMIKVMTQISTIAMAAGE